MAQADQWRVSFATRGEGAIRAVAHRRLIGGIEVREGQGESAEAAVAQALGRKRLRFATRGHDITAEVAAFRGHSIRIALNQSVVTECEEAFFQLSR